MSVAYQSTCRLTTGQPFSVDISANISVEFSRHIDRYVGRYIERLISIDISINTRPICRPTYRSTLGRYVDQYVGRYVGRGVHKIHMIPLLTASCSHDWQIRPTQPLANENERLIELRGATFCCFGQEALKMLDVH